MSISENNRINVKDKALAGQRVIKVTNDGNTMYIPVGLSSTDPTGGVDVSIIPTTSDQVLSSTQYMTKEGVLESGSIETLSVASYTPDADGVIIPSKGKYCDGDITIEGDSNLTSGNIKKGVTIFGVDGSFEGGTSADLTNLTAENIKYGVTINGVQGTFSEELYYPAESSCILSPFRAFVNGKYIQGTIDDLGVSAPYDGYYPQATDLVIPSAGKFCAENIVISGDANFKSENIRDGVTIWGVEGSYEGGSFDFSGASVDIGYAMLEDTYAFDATGTLRTGLIPHASEGPQGVISKVPSKGMFYPAEGMPYGKHFTAGSFFTISGWDKIVPENIRDGVTIMGVSGTFTADANATSADILADKTAYVNGKLVTGTLTVSSGSDSASIEFYECSDVPSSSTWSGYKMTWSEGQAGDGFVISGADDNTYLNGEYALSESNGIRSWRKNYTEFEGYVLQYYTENPWGDISTGWVLFNEGGGGESYYVNQTVGATATVAEICAGPWLKDWGGGNTIPTFTPSGTPAGWSKTDELVEGLEIKGYTPEVGKVYAVDSTIAVSGMYPAEIATGGVESGSTVPYIEVSGAGSTDLNGKYYMKDANATGGSRAFALEDGSAEIFFDNTSHLTDIIGWMISKPGSSMAAYAASGNPDMSVEEICSATWSVSYGGTAPAPTLTYNSGSGSGDSGSGSGSGGGGSSTPTTGAADAVVVLKITYDDGTIGVISFTPDDLTATGNSRSWTYVAPGGTAWTLLNEGDWCVKDPYSEYMVYGVVSPDPWNGDWSKAGSQTISFVSIECIAIEI